MRPMKTSLIRIFNQFIYFGAIGTIGTLFHYVTLVSLVQFLELRPIIGSAAGFTIGAFVNYTLNYHITFRSTRSHRIAMPKFYMIALVGLCINTVIIYILNEWLTINYLIAQIISTGIVFVSNFTGNKLWTFKEVAHVSDHQKNT
jgi:putative flippase GtrA